MNFGLVLSLKRISQKTCLYLDVYDKAIQEHKELLEWEYSKLRRYLLSFNPQKSSRNMEPFKWEQWSGFRSILSHKNQPLVLETSEHAGNKPWQAIKLFQLMSLSHKYAFDAIANEAIQSAWDQQTNNISSHCLNLLVLF